MQPEKINTMKIMDPYLSIIILNLNGLNSSIKKHEVADFFLKIQLYVAWRDSL
jgi:hypothetical protein